MQRWGWGILDLCVSLMVRMVTKQCDSVNNNGALEVHSFFQLLLRVPFSVSLLSRSSLYFLNPIPVQHSQHMQQRRRRRIHKLKSITLAIKSIATNYLSLKQMILKFFYVMIINFLLLVTHSLAHIRTRARTYTHIDDSSPSHWKWEWNGDIGI